MKVNAVGPLVAALLLMLMSAPPAAAAGSFHRRHASVVAEVQMRGTHAFDLDLVAVHHSVNLSVSKVIARLGGEGATYSSRRLQGSAAGFRRGRLNVRIGRLGRFRAHFFAVSSKTERTTKGECADEPTTIETGYFVGSLFFRGEGGYTRVHDRRAPGTVTRIPAARCVVPSPSVRSDNEIRLLAGDKGANTVVRASREETSSGSKVTPTSFLATVTGRSGGVRVIRSAFVLDFHFDPGATFMTPNLAGPLREVTVRPPVPFSGSASFVLEDSNAANWTGDLAVEMPGLGRVPLAGGSLEAGLCEGVSKCTDTLSPRLARIVRSPTGFGARSGTISVVGFRNARALADL